MSSGGSGGGDPGLLGSVPKGVVWFALAGSVVGIGVAAYLVGNAKIKRSNKGSNQRIGTQRSASHAPSPNAARIPLSKAVLLDPETLYKELEYSRANNDVASEINLLYALGAACLKANFSESSATISRSQTLEAKHCFMLALQLASQIKSEMEAVLEVELGVLHFTLQESLETINFLERGLSVYINYPAASSSDALNTQSQQQQYLLNFFIMLVECYHTLKEYKRGIAFLLKTISTLKERSYLQEAEGEGQSAVQAELLPNLYFHVGELYFAADDHERCAHYLEQVDESQVQMLISQVIPSFYSYLGNSYHATRQYEKAVAALNKYLTYEETQMVPESVLKCMTLLATAHRELDNKASCSKCVEEAINIISQMDTNKNILLALQNTYKLGIMCSSFLEEYDKALFLLEKAHALAKTLLRDQDSKWTVNIVLDLADVCVSLKKRERAIELIETTLEDAKKHDKTGDSGDGVHSSPIEDPEFRAAMIASWIKLAKLHSEQCQKEQAVRVLKQALKLVQPYKNADKSLETEGYLRYQLGKILSLMGRLSEASDHLAASFELYSNSSNVSIRASIGAALANNKIQAGHFAEGMELLKEIQELAHNKLLKSAVAQEDVCNDTGEVFLFLGRLDEAQKDLEKAYIAAKEKNTRNGLASLLRWASVCTLQSDNERAAQLLEDAQKLADENESSLQQGSVAITRANYHMSVGEIAAAELLLQVAEQNLDPQAKGSTSCGVSTVKATRAALLLWSGREEESIRCSEECLAMMQEDPIARENKLLSTHLSITLAVVYFHAGRFDTAVDLLWPEEEKELVVVEFLRKNGLQRALVEALCVVGAAKCAQGGVFSEDAKVAFEEAEALLGEDKALQLRFKYYKGLALAHEDETEARFMMEEAFRLAEETGDKLIQGLVMLSLIQLADKAGDETEEPRKALSSLAQECGNVFLQNMLDHSSD
ncbi:hypothetical protein QOT17_013853 [Balamuthia mandrillaris]